VGAVNEQLTTMVGSKHAIETALGFAPTDADKLVRALQLMIDSGQAGCGGSQLGLGERAVPGSEAVGASISCRPQMSSDVQTSEKPSGNKPFIIK